MKTNSVEWIGWLSSMILVATIVKQIHKQWVERTSEGVSKWLFLGQVAAEVGFIVYAWMLKSWVFLVTNAVLLAANLFGYALVLHHRRLDARAAATRGSAHGQKEENAGKESAA